jgi:PPOX class probable F420-dependent enzyme
MNPDQLAEITEPPILGILTTVNADGSPQATPIWYYYDGEHFNVTCYGHRVKARNIRRDPRVTLVVVDTANYGDPLMVSGTAVLVEEGAAEATVRVAIRYEGDAAGRASAARLNARGHRVIIRIIPQRVRHGL